MQDPNRFGIFLPVKNGGEYFKQCVFSILSQTNKNFDLIILINFCTDGSTEWIYTLNDSRITVIESYNDLTIEENWLRILPCAKNIYMTIIGHDDIFEKNYLETMDNLINKYPDAGLYQSHFKLIDENGLTIRQCKPMPIIENSSEFLNARFTFTRDSFGTGYMFRSADYVKVGGIPIYSKLLFSDDALWVMLMKNSFKATASEICFSYRLHNKSMSSLPGWDALLSALEKYMNTLNDIKAQNNEIKNVIDNRLSKYLILWFKLAYFNSKTKSHKKEIYIQILKIIKSANNLFAGESIEKFKIDVDKYVFSNLAYFRYLYQKIYIRAKFFKLLGNNFKF